MKLTVGQKHALARIAENPSKSGAFWRDLGISPQTISSLEHRGLAGGAWRPLTGETSILRRSWHVTEAGRDALKDNRP